MTICFANIIIVTSHQATADTDSQENRIAYDLKMVT